MYHKASRDGNVLLLLEGSKRDFFKRDEFGMLPLHWAARDGCVESARVILGCAPETANARVDNGHAAPSAALAGYTPLHLAAANGHLDCVSYLLNFGCNLWSIALEYCSGIDDEAAPKLNSTHGQTKQRHHTALDLAAAAGHSDVVRCLDHYAAVELGARHSAQMKNAAEHEFDKLVAAASKLSSSNFFHFRILNKNGDECKQQLSHMMTDPVAPTSFMGTVKAGLCSQNEYILCAVNNRQRTKLSSKKHTLTQKLLKILSKNDRSAEDSCDERNYKPPGIVTGEHCFHRPTSRQKDKRGDESESPTTCSKTWQWSKSFESKTTCENCWPTVNNSGRQIFQRGIFERSAVREILLEMDTLYLSFPSRPGFGSVTFRSLEMSSIFPRHCGKLFEESNFEENVDFDIY